MRTPPTETPRQRLLLWIWKHLPFGGTARLFLTWCLNLRYAVGVAVVITNEHGEVLLLRHTYRRGIYDWGLPGGWVKGHERMERAIVRELHEETAWILALDHLVAVYSGYALPRLIVLFKGHLAGGTFRPSAEVSEYAFCPPDQLDRILPWERLAVQQALGLLHGTEERLCE
jgi:8-oxo-dGTP diphosphatase